MAPLTWLITGVSSGLGRFLTLHVLARGHRVIGTVRSRAKSADTVIEIEEAGGKILELDMNDVAAVADIIASTSKIYSTIDVVVNNAGYSLIGAVEDINDEESVLQFETNFFGPLRLIRAFLPVMRARKSGTIVNVTSIAGQDGLPSCGLYAASKFALEGLSESLAREMKPFNVHVLIVEPGLFRTNFFSSIQVNSGGVTEPYKTGPVQVALDKFKAINGKQSGNPKEAAARMFEAVTGEGMAGGVRGKVLRLPLGSDCVERIEAKIKSLARDLEKTREASLSTDYIAI